MLIELLESHIDPCGLRTKQQSEKTVGHDVIMLVLNTRAAPIIYTLSLSLYIYMHT